MRFSFGWSKGVETKVSVALEQADLRAIIIYALSEPTMRMAGMFMFDVPSGDDGDGEELPVPRISRDELAELQTTRSVN